MKLALYSRGNLAWDSNIKKEQSSATEFSIGYTVRSSEEVDLAMALAKSAGAKIPKPAQKTFWGGYAGYFQDPDGYLWEILWNPNFLPAIDRCPPSDDCVRWRTILILRKRYFDL